MKTMRNLSGRYETVSNTRSPYLLWLIWVIWLPLIIPAFIQLIQSHPSFPLLSAMLAGTALFFGIYLWGGWLTAQKLVVTSSLKQTEALTWLILFALATLSFGLTILAPKTGWQSLFIYTSGYMGGSLTIVRIFPAVFALFLALITAHLLAHLGWFDILQVAIFIPTVILIVKIVIWSILTSWELRTAREEIARLAVTAERLRIARDLHDLLGHSLVELPTCRTLILTTFGRPGYLRQAMESGAAGFLLKDAPATQLATAIRRVMAGERVVDPTLALSALSEGNNPLTERERNLLTASLHGASITEIATSLFLSEGTIRNYLSVAIQKLGVRNRIEAAHLAQQKGWL